MANLLACTVRTRLQAETLLMRMRAGNVPTAAISLLFRCESGALSLARDRDSHLSARSARDVPPDGMLGGVLGGLSGVTVMHLPMAGLHVVAGPLGAALQPDGSSAAACSLGQALQVLGLPEPGPAGGYQALVSDGQVLLAICDDRAGAMGAVARLLTAAGAEHVHYTDPCCHAQT